jgi:hypothetical protein
MQKTYQLAKQGNANLPNWIAKPFGPLMTLDQAQAYQEDMRLGGFDVLVINRAEGLPNL